MREPRTAHSSEQACRRRSARRTPGVVPLVGRVTGNAHYTRPIRRGRQCMTGRVAVLRSNAPLNRAHCFAPRAASPDPRVVIVDRAASIDERDTGRTPLRIAGSSPRSVAMPARPHVRIAGSGPSAATIASRRNSTTNESPRTRRDIPGRD